MQSLYSRFTRVSRVSDSSFDSVNTAEIVKPSNLVCENADTEQIVCDNENTSCGKQSRQSSEVRKVQVNEPVDELRVTGESMNNVLQKRLSNIYEGKSRIGLYKQFGKTSIPKSERNTPTCAVVKQSSCSSPLLSIIDSDRGMITLPKTLQQNPITHTPTENCELTVLGKSGSPSSDEDSHLLFQTKNAKLASNCEGIVEQIVFPQLPLSPNHSVHLKDHVGAMGDEDQVAGRAPTLSMLCPKFSFYPPEHLCHWGIPKEVSDLYTRYQSVQSLYQWQIDCLSLNNDKVLSGGNLVYVAPTGGGKSLVADIIMLRNIYSTGRKALFVVPFVSMVREKAQMFSKVLGTEDLDSRLPTLAVHGESGGGVENGVSGAIHSKAKVIVCTLEKAVSIINVLIVLSGAEKCRQKRLSILANGEKNLHLRCSHVCEKPRVCSQTLAHCNECKNNQLSETKKNSNSSNKQQKTDCECSTGFKHLQEHSGIAVKDHNHDIKQECKCLMRGEFDGSEVNNADELAFLDDTEWVDVFVSKLGCVIIDEVHIISDHTRGPLLESMLAKLKFISHLHALRNCSSYSQRWRNLSVQKEFLVGRPNSQFTIDLMHSTTTGEPWNRVVPSVRKAYKQSVKKILKPELQTNCSQRKYQELSLPGLQIVAMSATLGTPNVLAKSLSACLYATDFRPLELQKFLKVGPYILKSHETDTSALGEEIIPERQLIARKILQNILLSDCKVQEAERVSQAASWPSSRAFSTVKYHRVLDSAAYLAFLLPDALLFWINNNIEMMKHLNSLSKDDNVCSRILHFVTQSALNWTSTKKVSSISSTCENNNVQLKVVADCNDYERGIIFRLMDEDVDQIGLLVIESIKSGDSALIFCKSKRDCELSALRTAGVLHQLESARSQFTTALLEMTNKLSKDELEESCFGQVVNDIKEELKLQQIVSKQRLNILTMLFSRQYLLDPLSKFSLSLKATDDKEEKEIVSRILSEGIFLDHTGVGEDVQKLVRQTFGLCSSAEKCSIPVIGALFATTTLAAGVNLPVSRVIVYGTRVSGTKLGVSHFQQMIGRSGRAGHSKKSFGDSILIVPDKGRKWEYKVSHQKISPQEPDQSIRSLLRLSTFPRIDSIPTTLTTGKYLENLFCGEKRSKEKLKHDICVEEIRSLSLTLPGGPFYCNDKWLHDVSEAAALFVAEIDQIDPQLVDKTSFEVEKSNCLNGNDKLFLYAQDSLERFILEVCVLGICQTLQQLSEILACTISSHKDNLYRKQLLLAASSALTWLINNEFLSALPISDKQCLECGFSDQAKTCGEDCRRTFLIPKKLGRATISAGLSARDALISLSTIQHALDRGLILSCDLHPCSLFIPPRLMMSSQPKWISLHKWLVEGSNSTTDNSESKILRMKIASSLGLDFQRSERRYFALTGKHLAINADLSSVYTNSTLNRGIRSPLAMPESFESSEASLNLTQFQRKLRSKIGLYNPTFAFNILSNTISLEKFYERTSDMASICADLSSLSMKINPEFSLCTQNKENNSHNDVLASIVFPAELEKNLENMKKFVLWVKSEVAAHRIWIGAQMEAHLALSDLSRFFLADEQSEESSCELTIRNTNGIQNTDTSFVDMMVYQSSIYARSLGVFAADLGYTNLSLICLSYAEAFSSKVPAYLLPLKGLVAVEIPTLRSEEVDSAWESSDAAVTHGNVGNEMRAFEDSARDISLINDCFAMLDHACAVTVPSSDTSIVKIDKRDRVSPASFLPYSSAQALFKNGLCDAPSIASAGPFRILAVLVDSRPGRLCNNLANSEVKKPVQLTDPKKDILNESTEKMAENIIKSTTRSRGSLYQMGGKNMKEDQKKSTDELDTLDHIKEIDDLLIRAQVLQESGAGIYSKKIKSKNAQASPKCQVLHKNSNSDISASHSLADSLLCKTPLGSLALSLHPLPKTPNSDKIMDGNKDDIELLIDAIFHDMDIASPIVKNASEATFEETKQENYDGEIGAQVLAKSTRAERVLAATLFVRAKSNVTRKSLEGNEEILSDSSSKQILSSDQWDNLISFAKRRLDPFVQALEPDDEESEKLEMLNDIFWGKRPSSPTQPHITLKADSSKQSSPCKTEMLESLPAELPFSSSKYASLQSFVEPKTDLSNVTDSRVDALVCKKQESLPFSQKTMCSMNAPEILKDVPMNYFIVYDDEDMNCGASGACPSVCNSALLKPSNLKGELVTESPLLGKRKTRTYGQVNQDSYARREWFIDLSDIPCDQPSLLEEHQS